MARYQAAVRRAVAAEQPDLLDRAEHCSADGEALAPIGRTLGHQVRLQWEPPGQAGRSAVALYTISELRTETPAGVVRMGSAGRQRISPQVPSPPFEVSVESVVARRHLDDATAARLGEFVERLRDDGSHRGLIVIAPHGGDIERHTDAQARQVADRLADHAVSSWSCLGFDQEPGDAYRRFHITSNDLHAASFPELGAVIGRGFRYAVAFHGFRGEGVLVGGAAPFRLRAAIAAALEEVLDGTGQPVRIAGPDDVLGGSNPSNVVNRLTANGRSGVQLEQGMRAREQFGEAIADAVARVFAIRLTRPPVPPSRASIPVSIPTSIPASRPTFPDASIPARLRQWWSDRRQPPGR